THELRAKVGAAYDAKRRSDGWRRKLAIITHVIIRACRTRGGASNERNQSGKRIGRTCGKRLQVIHSGLGEFRKIGAIRLPAIDSADAFGTVGKIQRVHSIDADQQNMAYRTIVVPITIAALGSE